MMHANARVEKEGNLRADYSQLKEKLWFKYLLDTFFAVFLLVFTVPVFLFFALAIKIEGFFHPENGGSIFYVEPRMSEGNVFRFIKFRTAPREVLNWVKEDPESRSVTGERKRTLVGRFLISWYLDELPQLINILKGEMSFVGPRPHIIKQTMDEINDKGLVFRKYMRGGLLGVLQANKRDKKYQKMFSDMATKHKSAEKALIKMDTLYADKCLEKSIVGVVFFDVYLIFRGLIVVFKGGAKV